MKKSRKRLLVLGLTAMLAYSQVMAVNADLRSDLEDVKQQKSQTKAALSEAEYKIDVLEDKKTAITGEINTLDSELIVTLAAIESLKGEITNKEEEIVVTEANLLQAEEDEEEQYQLMKKRIQFLYETGGNAAWLSLILNGKSYSEILNQAEYTQKLYSYDRECLDEYMEIVQQVSDYKVELETQKAELEESKAEQEVQQQNLEQLLSEKRATCADYSSQISNLESKASHYASLIAEQNAQIQTIQRQIEIEEEAARRAAEEAARQAAAAEAARQAAAAEAARQEEAAQRARQEEAVRTEAQRRQQASAQSSSSGSSSSSSSSSSGSSSSSSSSSSGSSSSSSASSAASSGSSSSSSSGSSGSGASYSGTGQSVINYACQFIGNPYVWGGESLTRGADCSGFIMAVYAHFGVSLPHSSAAMRSCGRGVSYSEARPGDIICYDGHVALYMGNGQIVHASNARDGIKISPNAAYRTILAVRRVI